MATKSAGKMVDVTVITFCSGFRSMYCKFVLIARKDSVIVDFGFSTTGNSELNLL